MIVFPTLDCNIYFIYLYLIVFTYSYSKIKKYFLQFLFKESEFNRNLISAIEIVFIIFFQIFVKIFDINITYFLNWCLFFVNNNWFKKSLYWQDDDRRRGGLTLSRYQELYAQFLGNPDENCPANYLFGPIES